MALLVGANPPRPWPAGGTPIHGANASCATRKQTPVAAMPGVALCAADDAVPPDFLSHVIAAIPDRSASAMISALAKAASTGSASLALGF